MIRKVSRYIEEKDLIPKRNTDIKIIVGLSGGADSVVLLSILARLNYNCIALHCNFHLRGNESLRDERVSEQFAKDLNIPFFKKDFNTIKYAKENNISIEMAARDLRYEWFEQMRVVEKADFIAVAHHSDDNIETYFLNLIRGTGINGLTGIPPKNGKVIRPLLILSKKEILEYVQKEKINYITDSTNLQEEFTRNKIRLSLLPFLETINPSIHDSILRTIDNLTEVRKIYEAEINRLKKDVFDRDKGFIYIRKLKEATSQEAILYEILKEFDFDRDNIKNVVNAIDSQSGKEFYSPQFKLIKDREKFILLSRENEMPDRVYKIGENEQIINNPISLQLSFMAVNDSFKIKKNKNIAYFDKNKLQFPLIIRRWKAGDKFVPFGMTGFQKLSDYFNNNKISKPEKEKTWLLCSENNIIWIIGHRTDNRYKITSETQNACIIKLF